jgi:hypothetical protein
MAVMSASESDGHTVSLPPDVVARIEDRLPYCEFDTVDDYAAFVLRETLARVEEDRDASEPIVDEATVEQRLESLGYLDK